MKKIINYNKLCGIKKQVVLHPLNYVGEKNVGVIFTKKQLELVFNETAGIFLPKTITGGFEEEKILVIE